MTRVSEGSSRHAIQYSVGRTKSKLENLQLKGSNLKRIQRPSDDPVGNVKLLAMRSQKIDSKQYLRNSSVAKAQLTFTENAIEELTELVSKAKELAIGQSSNLFDRDIRQSVSKEIHQLRNQAVSIGNRRLGNKYIFGGHKSLSKPFNLEGEYLGDKNRTRIEIAKDLFVPISFNGEQIFLEKVNSALVEKHPLEGSPLDNFTPAEKVQQDYRPPEREDLLIQIQPERDLASVDNEKNIENEKVRSSIFQNLETLENALLTNNHEIIQGLLPKLDDDVNRLIEVRTQIGSSINTIDSANESTENDILLNDEYKSKIEDADVAELYTDLTRQQNTLNATYKASAQLMNKSLLDFVR